MNINYLNFNNTTTFHNGKVPYITFKSFEKLDFIRHGFSTRLGGVSGGEYSTMNLTFNKEDDVNSVSRNFELIGHALGIETNTMVYARQTHTINVMEVTKEHMGMGVLRERSFDNIDGLVTNDPKVTLVTSYADCVPLFFADPITKAIGLSHSGWRGTVNNIAKETIELMGKLYGTQAKDIKAFIGPSICRDCYEISQDVADEFIRAFGVRVFDNILYPKDNGKYLLDLHQANYLNFINSGINQANISITDICTCCNPDILFSHRASRSGGLHGLLCGFLQIK